MGKYLELHWKTFTAWFMSNFFNKTFASTLGSSFQARCLKCIISICVLLEAGPTNRSPTPLKKVLGPLLKVQKKPYYLFKNVNSISPQIFWLVWSSLRDTSDLNFRWGFPTKHHLFKKVPIFMLCTLETMYLESAPCIISVWQSF